MGISVRKREQETEMGEEFEGFRASLDLTLSVKIKVCLFGWLAWFIFLQVL